MSNSGDGSGGDSVERTSPNQGGSATRPTGTAIGPSVPTSGTAASAAPRMFSQQPPINYPMGYGHAPSAFRPVQQGNGRGGSTGFQGSSGGDQFYISVGDGGGNVGAGAVGGSGLKRGPEGGGDGSTSDPKRQQIVVSGGENDPNNPPPPPPPPPERFQFRCSVCPAAFDVQKALFGHMRCHKDRPWKGVHPPPAFSRDEFVGVPILGEGGVFEGAIAAEAPAVVVDETAVEAPPQGIDTVGDSSSGQEVQGGGGGGQGESSMAQREMGASVWDRDLNKSPPPDSDEEEQ